MKHEWKPGDVAAVRDGNPITFYVEGGEVMFTNEHGYQYPARHLSPDARRLVVIDPEDRDAVERLLRGYAGWKADPDDIRNYPEYVDHMQAALREFANPTPPKPEEPTGLGAVVEGADGRQWVRVAGDPAWASYDPPMDYHDMSHYDDFAVVRVLSEGVQP